MKRFSPKQTLSNIKTAVRETVDFVNMKNRSIGGAILVRGSLAFMSLLILAVFTLSPSARADRQDLMNGVSVAQNNNNNNINRPPTGDEIVNVVKSVQDQMKTYCPGGTDPNEVICSYLKVQLGNTEEKKEQMCDRYVSDIRPEVAKAKATCQKAGYANSLGVCYGMISKCNSADESVDGDFDGTNAEEYCSVALSNACPGLPRYNDGTDYRADEKETERDRKDDKREVDDLMKDLQQQQREQAKNRRESLEAQQDNDKQVRDRERKLSKDVVDQLEGVKNSSKESYDTALKASSDMELEYVKMRTDARAATDMVEQAKDDLMSICRVSAEKKYQEAEKTRLALLASRKKNLGAGTAVSGSAKRTKAAVARARTIDYNNFFTECTSGNSPDGVGGTNRIKTAMRAQASANALMAEKQTLIEKRRAEMLQKMSTLETEAKAKGEKIQQDAQEELARLNEDARTAATRNAARVAEQTASDTAATNLLQSKLQQANMDLMKSQTKAASAADRSACAGRNATRSESRREKTNDGFESAHSDIEGLALLCSRAEGKKCSDLPTECNDAKYAKAGLMGDGKTKVKLKSFDSESVKVKH